MTLPGTELSQRMRDIAMEAMQERVRAALQEGFDLDHDLSHGGSRHAATWASHYLHDAFQITLEAEGRRAKLVKAAGLMLAAIDAHDHEAEGAAS